MALRLAKTGWRFAAASLAGITLACAIGATQSATATAQTRIPPTPKDFVMSALQSDQYEIDAARVAAVEGQNPRVREFAQEMIRDHTRTKDALRETAQKAGIALTEVGVSGDQARLLGSLQSLRGAEFDKAYVRQQVLAHTQAVVVSESFGSDGSNETLKQAASSALPTIQHHLKAAQDLQAGIGK